MYNKETFWSNTLGTFALMADSDDFDALLLDSVKKFSNREAISHFNKRKDVFWIRYDSYALRIANNDSYNNVIGENCNWKIDKKSQKKYSIAKIEYKNLTKNI